jgi:acyl carrier protein
MESIEQVVLRLVADKAERGEVGRSSTWEELGLDSLDVTELVMQLEERFGVTVPDAEATALKCPGDVIAYLRRLKGSDAA